MLNLITEPLIEIDTPHGAQLVSLPELYAALMDDRVDAFTYLRSHQRHALHAFLVQLAVIALQNSPHTVIPRQPEQWAQLLRALTPEFPDDEPWQLAVDDITKPAFLQPPANLNGNNAYRRRFETPDEMDILVNAKNHRNKQEIAWLSNANEWLYALISVQTMGGYSGAGWYGISRMNGGLSNRPAFSLSPSLRPGPHVRRDIEVLHKDPKYRSDQAGLLWMLPWNGNPAEALTPPTLHPLYIEICRRLRLLSDHEFRIHGVGAGTKAARIANTETKGRVGDPWTPCNPKRDDLPLTLSHGGFDYRRIIQLLTEWQRPELLTPTPEEAGSDQPTFLIARATVRGQGKTEGHYERIVPLAPAALGSADGATPFANFTQLASSRITQAAALNGILNHAITAYTSGGNTQEATPQQRQTARFRTDRLDRIIDREFFRDLQPELATDDPEQRLELRRDWFLNPDTGIISHARRILRMTEHHIPAPVARREYAQTQARAIFEGRVRRDPNLAFLFAKTEDLNTGEPNAEEPSAGEPSD